MDHAEMQFLSTEYPYKKQYGNRSAMQIDANGIKAEHQRSPSAAINAVTSGASCREHSSSTVTLFGRCADRRAVGRDTVARCL